MARKTIKKGSFADTFREATAYNISKKFNDAGYTYLAMGDKLKPMLEEYKGFFLVDLDLECTYQGKAALCIAYGFPEIKDQVFYTMITEQSNALYDAFMAVKDVFEYDPSTLFTIIEKKSSSSRNYYNKLMLVEDVEKEEETED